MSGPAFRCQSGTFTHQGCVRGHNEDSFHADQESGLWAVADGMGGHESGERASAVIVEELAGGVGARAFDDACGEVADRIHRANGLIYQEAEARGVQMGSTVVALYVDDRRFAIFWVGDSRAYLLRGGTLYQISRDHTQLQDMIERGFLAPEDAADHPMGHVLARAVGVAPEVEVDVIQDEVEPGDTFLLCSDGLHGCLGDDTIAAVLADPSIEAAARTLVDLTLEAGAPDNVTVVAVRFSEATMLDLPTGAAA